MPSTPSSNPAADGPPRILVVDDNETNRRIAELQVAGLGYVAVPVAGGAAALERLAVEPFDLVLLDAMMPGLDGPAVAREVRRREAAAGGQRIPIVATTASVLPEDVARMLGAGMDDHLAKPLQAGDLAAVLGRRLPTEGRRAGVIPPPASTLGAAATGDAAGLLDPDAIEGLVALGDAQLVERVLRLFLADAAARVAEVDEAIATRGMPRLHAALDGLVTICHTLGATALGARARAIHDDLRGREERGEDPFGRDPGPSGLEPMLDATRARLEDALLSPRGGAPPPAAGTSSRGCRPRR